MLLKEGKHIVASLSIRPSVRPSQHLELMDLYVAWKLLGLCKLLNASVTGK